MGQDYRAVYHTPTPNDGVGHTHLEEGSVDVYIDAIGTGAAGITDNSVVILDPNIRSDVTEFVAAISFLDDPDEDTGATLIPSPSNASVLLPVSNPEFTPPPNGETDVPVIPPLYEIPTDCTDIFEEVTNYAFPTNFFLSPNFTVGSLTVGCALSHYSLRPQLGLTTNQIVCNMRQLCVNVLEPLKAQFPNMFLTSGFRHGSGSSQHNKGQAVDVQLSGTNFQQQWDGSQWVAENLTYDQFILELGNNYWYHLSYSNGSNRQQVLTRVRPGNYQPNLIRLV